MPTGSSSSSVYYSPFTPPQIVPVRLRFLFSAYNVGDPRFVFIRELDADAAVSLPWLPIPDDIASPDDFSGEYTVGNTDLKLRPAPENTSFASPEVTLEYGPGIASMLPLEPWYNVTVDLPLFPLENNWRVVLALEEARLLYGIGGGENVTVNDTTTRRRRLLQQEEEQTIQAELLSNIDLGAKCLVFNETTSKWDGVMVLPALGVGGKNWSCGIAGSAWSAATATAAVRVVVTYEPRVIPISIPPNGG